MSDTITSMSTGSNPHGDAKLLGLTETLGPSESTSRGGDARASGLTSTPGPGDSTSRGSGDARSLGLSDTLGLDGPGARLEPPTPDDSIPRGDVKGLGLSDTLASAELGAPRLPADAKLLGLSDTFATPAPRFGATPREALGARETVDASPTGERDDRPAGVGAAAGALNDARRKALVLARMFGKRAAPPKIGRFTILDRLGAGGMGVVYAAYDERLERKIAVKVLRAEIGGEASRARLLREAQAMARLSHPNIVAVHEVGDEGDDVYVAMEFVRGVSLDRWLEQRRPWREVVSVFTQAGRGLMAAHAAGIIHRDFKPHNVMLGEDERVRVLDFGLASALPQPREAADEDAPRDVRLTRTGAMLGTPAYMSPEQFERGEVTAASDQFSFFVALHEGLFGQLPHQGETLRELAERVTAGERVAPPVDASVPAWVRRVVDRGLRRDPAERYPDMSAALAALARDPVRRARRVAGLGGLVLAGAGASAGLLSVRGVELCPSGELDAPLVRSWSDARRTAARAAFASASGGFGEETWALVEPRIASWAAEWSRLRGDRCEARAAGVLSETLHDRAVFCLERQLSRVDELLAAFTSADAASVLQAPGAVASLPPLSACVDVQFLMDERALPEDPAARAAVLRGRERLARARALIDLGRYADAVASAEEVASTARAIESEPLLALADVVRGDALQWSRDETGADAALSAAIVAGLASGDDRAATEALARRIFVRAELSHKPELALHDVETARALLRRVDAGAGLSWLLENNVAVAYQRAHDQARAAESYERALEHADAIGEDSLPGVYTRFNYGQLSTQRADFARARRLLAEASAAGQRLFGASHPTLVALLEGEATLAYESGRHEAALERLRRARALAERREMIDALARITELQARIAVQRRQPEARALADEAETRARAAYGAEHPRASFAKIRAWYLRDAASEQDRATLAKLAASAPELWPWALNNYANALLLADRPREVVELLAWARALEGAPAITGTVGQGLELLELAAMIDAGMIDDAARRLDELARTLEPEASIMQRVDFASYRGRIAAARGDWPAAVTHDRDALELYDRMTAEDSLPARLRVSVDLARALLATGERDAAASRLSAALASYRALGQGFAPEIAEVERMLSTGG